MIPAYPLELLPACVKLLATLAEAGPRSRGGRCAVGGGEPSFGCAGSLWVLVSITDSSAIGGGGGGGGVGSTGGVVGTGAGGEEMSRAAGEGAGAGASATAGEEAGSASARVETCMSPLASKVAINLSSLSRAPIRSLWSLRPGVVLFNSLLYNFL